MVVMTKTAVCPHVARADARVAVEDLDDSLVLYL